MQVRHWEGAEALDGIDTLLVHLLADADSATALESFAAAPNEARSGPMLSHRRQFGFSWPRISQWVPAWAHHKKDLGMAAPWSIAGILAPVKGSSCLLVVYKGAAEVSLQHRVGCCQHEENMCQGRRWLQVRLELVEEALREKKRFHALALLCSNSGASEEALTLWQVCCCLLH